MHDAPADDFQRSLVDYTAPPDWPTPQPAERYNLVVLGAGPAGLVSAAGAASLGARVALIEKHRLGGDCLHYGCVPSKALLRCGRAVAEVRRAGKFGVRVGGEVSVDFPAVMERLRRLRAEISHHDDARRFRDLGVDVFFGAPRFTGPDVVSVNGQELRFARAVVATGARPVDIPLPGLDPALRRTNETIFNLTELPRRLVILGAGPIGCELAQAFARFGSEVHVADVLPQLLPREEPEVGALLRRRLEQEGVQLHLGAKAVRGETKDGAHFVVLEQNGQERQVAADVVLVAVGRKPNVEDLGLDVAGVQLGKQGVEVNDYLQTSNPHIYAAGDVCSAFKFTHAADAMARLLLRNALFFGRARVSALVIPWCTYTDPEVAHVGLTAAEAKEKNIAVQTFRLNLTEVDRAVLDGDTEGFAIVHTAAKSDRILGATVVASHAGDLLAEVVLAMTEKRGLGALSRAVHSYPTQGELLRKLGDAYQRSRLTPRTAGVLRTLLRWRR